MNAPLVVLGWREWVALPALGISQVKAKVDTGARSSALHVSELHRFQRAGRSMVRFALQLTPVKRVRAEAVVVDEREVTDSGGHVTVRPFIQTQAVLGGIELPMEINLCSRTKMLFPMLIGRTALGGRFLVDPAQSFLQGG